jgi:hypothetical protein
MHLHVWILYKSILRHYSNEIPSVSVNNMPTRVKIYYLMAIQRTNLRLSTVSYGSRATYHLNTTSGH